VILLIAPLLSYLPMSALAALLLTAAWNIFDIRHCIQIVKIGNVSDTIVMLLCCGLTVFLDMTLAVGVGMVLAALLFMKQMANITGGRWLLEAAERGKGGKLPARVMVYEISGPLFFGAAEKAMSTLRGHAVGLKIVILQMGGVPTMDISGLVALKSALNSLSQQRIFVILSSVQEQPMTVLKRANLLPAQDVLAFCDSLEASIRLAKKVKLH
jgi:SulP family sulfate permease